MKKAIVIAALAAVLAPLFATSQAMAGDWEFGCQGKNAAGDSISFNRNQLVTAGTVVSSPVPEIKLAADGISKYDADDSNSGLTKTMTFTHAYTGTTSTSKVKLTELKSKKVSEKHSEIGCTDNRVRDFDTTISTKLYQIEGEGLKTEKVLMKCYDYMMSACG